MIIRDVIGYVLKRKACIPDKENMTSVFAITSNTALRPTPLG